LDRRLKPSVSRPPWLDGHHLSMNSIEIYAGSPTPFVRDRWKSLLPDWKVPPQTLVLVLLNAQCSLDGDGALIEEEKGRLLGHFLSLGRSFYLTSWRREFLSEIISPQDGTPQYSMRGEIVFDLIAIIHYSLGMAFARTDKGCNVLRHPRWQAAVYPGIFLSEAAVPVVGSILSEVTGEKTASFHR
jgi:hypothetical protein